MPADALVNSGAPGERAVAHPVGDGGGGVVDRDGRHAWLRLTPEKIVSWDFRELPVDRRQPTAN